MDSDQFRAEDIAGGDGGFGGAGEAIVKSKIQRHECTLRNDFFFKLAMAVGSEMK